MTQLVTIEFDKETKPTLTFETAELREGHFFPQGVDWESMSALFKTSTVNLFIARIETPTPEVMYSFVDEVRKERPNTNFVLVVLQEYENKLGGLVMLTDDLPIWDETCTWHQVGESIFLPELV